MEEKNDVGKIIAQARKKKNLTQQELAKLLCVSDKTVSAWETGKNYPDLGIIKNISKYLDIDLINILADKKSDTLKKVLKIFSICILSLVVIFFFVFGIYFFNNYNKIKIYEVSLDSKEYSLDNGMVVVTPDKIIFNLGNINGFEEEFDITLYYLENDKKVEIISKFNYDFLYYECINSFIDKVSDLDKIGIDISYYKDNKKVEKELSFKIKEKLSNDKFFNNKKELDTEVTDERLKVLLYNTGYKKVNNDKYVKEYKDKNLVYTYILSDKKLSCSYVEDEFEKNGFYDIENNKIYFYVMYNNYTIEEFFYENDKVNCTLGKCKDSEKMVSLLLDEYKKLK